MKTEKRSDKKYKWNVKKKKRHKLFYLNETHSMKKAIENEKRKVKKIERERETESN